jgi:hypothetical protein
LPPSRCDEPKRTSPRLPSDRWYMLLPDGTTLPHRMALSGRAPTADVPLSLPLPLSVPLWPASRCHGDALRPLRSAR